LVPTWSETKEHFERDGGLRELYVFDTDERDWERLLAALPSSPWSYDYLYEDERQPLPSTFGGAGTDEGTALLKIDDEVLALRCHFFTPKRVEFDLRPEDVKDAGDYKRLVGFMRWLADLLGKSSCSLPKAALIPDPVRRP
jgi:hypothetical protein